jgi:hypothetical protein
MTVTETSRAGCPEDRQFASLAIFARWFNSVTLRGVLSGSPGKISFESISPSNQTLAAPNLCWISGD